MELRFTYERRQYVDEILTERSEILDFLNAEDKADWIARYVGDLDTDVEVSYDLSGRA